MRNIKIDKEDAEDLLGREEGHFFDKKSSKVDGRGVQKIAVAFANADGGEFICGIKDEKEEHALEGRWDGVDKPEDFNGLLQAIFEVQPTLPLTYDALFCEHYDGYLLRVNVDKGSDVHKTKAGKVYVRFGPQSLPLVDPEKILALNFAKGAASFEDHTVDTVQPDALVESAEIRSFLDDYSPRTDPLDFS